MLRKAFLYWHTIIHLKPVQIYYRLWRRLYRPRPTDELPPALRKTNHRWISPVQSRQTLFGADEFEFLGKPGSLKKVGWNGSERDKLWRYNQHYFSYLNTNDVKTRIQIHHNLLKSWIENNPPGKGVGWETYPCSLRIVNWIKWSLNGNKIDDLELHSLGNQTRWLIKNIEWHILGNHLFANAKALIFAGLWFDGPEAQIWLDKGFKILGKEFAEQILPDGGHFELSTMYHVLAVEDVLDLLNICSCYQSALSEAQIEIVKKWKESAPSMINWLRTMCHPDGEISFFNDSAIGIAPHPVNIYDYADRLSIFSKPDNNVITNLPDSGYARLENKSSVLLVDMASVGPDYLPGHAHADTLSFELSIYGKRVICNSGTSVYGTSDERSRQRSTKAHSTIVVDGENSSEVWAGFRVARRATVFGAKIEERNGSLYAEAIHDGYSRLSGSPLHTRSWCLKNQQLCIQDKISGKGNHCAEIYFHFTPEWQPLVSNGNGDITLTSSNGDQILFKIDSNASSIVEIEPSTWHPGFGISVPNWRLRIKLSGAAPLHHKSILYWGIK